MIWPPSVWRHARRLLHAASCCPRRRSGLRRRPAKRQSERAASPNLLAIWQARRWARRSRRAPRPAPWRAGRPPKTAYLAAAIAFCGMSAKATVFSAVNCIERDMPPTNRIAQMTGSGMCFAIAAQAAIAAALMRPLTTSTCLNPKRRSTEVVSGFMTRLPANTVIIIRPASKAS
jgi:hypothetical protein